MTPNLYGDQVLAGDLLAANNIVWGTAPLEADDIVWGTNVIWGTNIVWGTMIELDNIVWGTGR